MEEMEALRKRLEESEQRLKERDQRLKELEERDQRLKELEAQLELTEQRGRPQASLPDNRDQVIGAFFDTTFRGDKVLDQFYSDIASDYSLWVKPDNKYLAPYVALVQSSGWGKSRLVYELYRKKVFVVYCSAMLVSSKGFPDRSPVLADKLHSKDLTHERVAAFIICSLRVLRKTVSDLGSEAAAKAWVDSQMDPRVNGESLKEIGELMPAVERELGSGVSAGRKELLEFLWQKIKDEVDAVLGGKDLAEMGPKIVFCFDEATSLVETELSNGEDTCFGVIRRVLSAVKYGVFGLMVGTNSTLTQLAPAWDPTFKVMRLNFELFSPVWLVGVADCHAHMPQHVPQHLRLLAFGRPLWGALLLKGSTVQEIVEMAYRKLLTGRLTGGGCSKELAVGLLGCSIGLDVTSWCETAEQAVAYHMMTVMWISKDRKQVMITSSSEPALSSAAARYFADEKLLCEVLASLADMCKDGIVEGGPRGELVVRLLLLLAMYEALRRKSATFYCGRVTVEEYLKVLFGRVPQGLENVKLQAELYFNAFSPTTVQAYTKGHLEKFFARCRAVQCRPREAAIDGQLPGTYEVNKRRAVGSSSTPVRAHNVLPVNYQAKRWKTDSPSKVKTAVEKMERLPALLNLVFQVGSPTASVKVMGQKKMTIVAHGLSVRVFPFLTQNVVTALDNVRGHDVLGKYADNIDKQSIVKKMAPLSY